MIVTIEEIIKSVQKRYSDIMTAIVNEDYNELYSCICSSLYAGDEELDGFDITASIIGVRV